MLARNSGARSSCSPCVARLRRNWVALPPTGDVVVTVDTTVRVDHLEGVTFPGVEWLEREASRSRAWNSSMRSRRAS